MVDREVRSLDIKIICDEHDSEWEIKSRNSLNFKVMLSKGNCQLETKWTEQADLVSIPMIFSKSPIPIGIAMTHNLVVLDLRVFEFQDNLTASTNFLDAYDVP